MTRPESSEPSDSPATSAEVARLGSAVTRLALRLEQFNLNDLLEVSKRPWKLIWTNFVAGLARGVGMFLGAGIAGTVTLGLLSWILYNALEIADKLPIINQLADVVMEQVDRILKSHPAKK